MRTLVQHVLACRCDSCRAFDARGFESMPSVVGSRARRPSQQPTQRIPRETLAACADGWRKELAERGVCGKAVR